MQGFCNLYISDIRLSEMPAKSSYLNRLPVVEHLKRCGRIELHKPVTFVIVENGTGKSTLLEAVAVAAGFNAEGGSRNFNFSTNESHSMLWQCLTLSKSLPAKDGFFLRAESVYNLASNIDEIEEVNNYGGVSLHAQSHGESFLSIIQNRFWGEGLYLLDEPEAALSPQRLMTLLVEIDRLVKNKSQLIIATHSPILMAYPHADILQLNDSGITRANYKDTEHYKVTKMFIDQPEKMLKLLLESEEAPL